MKRLVSIATLSLALIAPGFAAAGIKVTAPTPEAASPETPADFEPAEYSERIFAAFPGIGDFLFDAPSLPPVNCTPGAEPRTHAILIAPESIAADGWYQLHGARNDAALIASALVAGGADPANMVTLSENDATREGLARAALDLLPKIACDDTVVIHFSGWTFGADEIAFSTDGTAPFENGEKYETLAAYSAQHIDATDLSTLTNAEPFLALNQVEPGMAEVVSAPALSELVTQFRNRRAHVTVILDTRKAAGMELHARQLEIDPTALWSATQVPLAPPEGYVPHEFPVPTQLLTQHGGLNAFYASGANDMAFETTLPRGSADRKSYGVFSYKVGMAILANGQATVPDLVRRVETVSLSEGGEDSRDYNQRYIFRTTDPSSALIAEQRPPVPASGGAIKLISPQSSRSAAPMSKPEIDIEGRVEWPARAMIVTVNGREAPLQPDGRFATKMKLEAGLNEISIAALTEDNAWHRLSTEVFYQGDRDALMGTGKRYAVLIANQNYGESSGMAKLATPFADVDALAGVLREKYGYVTEAEFSGKTIPLVLKDASRSQIEALLFQISQFAGAADSVLLYYGGHGIFEQVTGLAFWVPADAVAGVPPTYLSASAISEALLRIQAGNILVISDSCYSGALLRDAGIAAPETIDEDRMRALQRLADRRSRVLITSGANEPVSDGGGGGHSVFARALLTGLEEMDEDAFSARELYDRFVLPMVVGNAAQEPQFRPIEKSGHEGGDVVFVRAN